MFFATSQGKVQSVVKYDGVEECLRMFISYKPFAHWNFSSSSVMTSACFLLSLTPLSEGVSSQHLKTLNGTKMESIYRSTCIWGFPFYQMCLFRSAIIWCSDVVSFFLFPFEVYQPIVEFFITYRLNSMYLIPVVCLQCCTRCSHKSTQNCVIHSTFWDQV